VTEVLNPTQFPEDADKPFCIDRRANIYFINAYARLKGEPEILKGSPDGKVSSIAAGNGAQQDGQAIFRHINSAAWSPDGSLYIRDDQLIRRVSPDGTVSTLPHSEDAAMAEDGEERLVRTMGMAADTAGNVSVANYWKRAVMKVTPDGQLVTILTSNWPCVPVGVAISGGNIYVLDRAHSVGVYSSAFCGKSTEWRRFNSARRR